MTTTVTGRAKSRLALGRHDRAGARFVRRLVIAVMTGLVAAAAAATDLFAAGLVAASGIAFAAAALPALMRGRFQPAEPVTWVVALTFSGVCLKVLAIGWLGTEDPLVSRTLLFGRPLEILLPGLWAVCVGLGAFSIGYIAATDLGVPGIRLSRTPLLTLDRRKLNAITAAVLLIGLGGLALLVIQSGGLSVLSAKRFNDVRTTAGGRLTSIAYLGFRVALLIKLPAYLLLASKLASGRYRGIRHEPLIALGLAVPIVAAVYTSNRAGVAIVAADILVLAYLLRRRISGRAILVTALVIVSTLVLLLAIRSTVITTGPDLVLRTFIGRDLLDVTKVAHIVHADLPLLNGRTLVGWTLAPVAPSSRLANEWLNLGNFVYRNAYQSGGAGITGVPASFIGELYLNFRWVGVMLGMFVFGGLTASLYRGAGLQAAVPTVGWVIYALTMNRLLVFGLSNDLGTGVTKTLLDVVPLLCIALVVRRRASQAVVAGIGRHRARR